MKRRETSFVTDGDLIIVKAFLTFLTGPREAAVGRFVLDTEAAFKTMTPERRHPPT